MPMIKLTKGELKKQRDALRQYYRYLPTLHLKKKQLQLEIHRQIALIRERGEEQSAKAHEAAGWGGLLADRAIPVGQWTAPSRVERGTRNIAGVDIPVYSGVVFDDADYDLFMTPLWVDHALEALRAIAALRAELALLEEGRVALEAELRTTSQRVNLFEKVKIPEAEEAIRRIKISIGDQLVNAVGRSKIAKAKIERSLAHEAAV